MGEGTMAATTERQEGARGMTFYQVCFEIRESGHETEQQLVDVVANTKRKAISQAKRLCPSWAKAAGVKITAARFDA